MSEIVVPPPAVWAQRSDVLYLTLNVECPNPVFKFTEDSMYFKGIGLPEKKNHEITINFYSKINPDKVVSKNTSRCIEFVISKFDAKAPYWPRLTTEKNKSHWLKVDFNRWKDEGSDDETNDVDDFFSLRPKNDSKLSFDDFDDDQEDSDDEAMPGLTEDKDEKEEEKK